MAQLSPSLFSVWLTQILVKYLQQGILFLLFIVMDQLWEIVLALGYSSIFCFINREADFPEKKEQKEYSNLFSMLSNIQYIHKKPSKKFKSQLPWWGRGCQTCHKDIKLIRFLNGIDWYGPWRDPGRPPKICVAGSISGYIWGVWEDPGGVLKSNFECARVEK